MNVPSKMLLTVLCMDAFLFLGMLAVQNINPESDLLNAFDSHLLTQYDTSNGAFQLQTANVTLMEKYFPGSQESVGGTGSGEYADIWNTIRAWIFEDSPLGMFLQIVGAPYFFLKAIFPSEDAAPIVFTFGALWFAFSMFSLIAWAIGRE